MTYISGKHLSRRTLLRGIGATVALPFLDAMTPAFAAVEKVVKPARRIAYIYVPNGIVMKDWTPQTVGANFELPRTLQPLSAHRDRMLVISGLGHKTGSDVNGDSTGPHSRAAATYLTGVRPKKTAGADIHSGISADQVASLKLGSTTKFASIEMGCEDNRIVGNCEAGYSCAYTNNISWRTDTTPMPPEVNPRALFERLFGANADSPAAAEERRVNQKSILDYVSQQTQQLNNEIGPKDRHKLDEYLTAVRSIEQRIDKAAKEPAIDPTIEKPDNIPADFGEYVRLMFDLMFVSFQSDLTRISTFMIGKELSFRAYREIGIPDSHHPLTHHRGNPEWIEKVVQINGYHMRQFAYFVDKMRNAREGETSLLDQSILLYGSSLSDGNTHDHLNLPLLVMGGGAGRLKTGQHIQYEGEPPMTNLHLALLDCMGVHAEALGDSTGDAKCLSDISAV